MSKQRMMMPEHLPSGQVAVLEERLATHKKGQKLWIGIPKEEAYQENRVALVPSSVSVLTSMGHHIVIESGAGGKANFPDRAYTEAGAEIARSRKSVYKSDVIIKVAPPSQAEIALLRPDQILISPLHLPIIDAQYLEALKAKRVIALAMEYIQDNAGSFPIVRTLSEIAGISAMQTAAELLSTTQGGRGVLLGGISGVPPAKVVILGAGVVGEFATRTALGLGAEVRVFDNNVYKLMRLQRLVGRQLFTSVINPIYLREELRDADVAIGAIHSRTGRAPMVVSEDMVANMKPGAVIIDVSIDQGGCFATSEVRSHERPTFERHGVVHYCVPNIPSRTARTSSLAISNILTSMLAQAEYDGVVSHIINDNPGLRHGVYIYKGHLTNEYLSQRFGLRYTSLDLLMPSRF